MSDLLPLSDFISIKHGFAFKGTFISTQENENCLLTPGNFAIGGGFKSSKFKYYIGEIPVDYILKENDLIVTMTDLSKEADTLGYSALVPNIKDKNILHNQRIGLVTFLNNEVDKEYLYFLMRSKEYRQHILSSYTGSTVKHTSPSRILSFKFNKPTLEQQKRIAKYLLDIEKKIQLNTQINQTLEQIAQAIFKSWFVDFDPVKAKINVLANGGTKNDAECAAMCVISGKTEAELTQLKDRQPEKYQELAKTVALFPSEMVESELGEIPKGWECKSISSICSMQNGYAFKSSEWSNDGLPVIKIGSIKPIIIDMDGIGYVHEKNESLRQEFLVREGDILVGLTGYVGEVGRVPKNINAVLNQRTAKFIPFSINSQYSYYCFIYCLSRSNKFKEYAITHAKGSAQANISTKELLNYQSVIACVDIHIEFEKVIFSLLEMILNNSGENNTLGKVRDELLPEIFIRNKKLI